MSKFSNPVYTKKQLSTLRPGDFVFLKWNDAPDQCVMLLERIDTKQKGDISLKYLTQGFIIDSHAVHTQIVCMLTGESETLKFPNPEDYNYEEESAKMALFRVGGGVEERPKVWPYVSVKKAEKAAKKAAK